MFYHLHFACRNSYFFLVWSKNKLAEVSHNWQKWPLKCIPGGRSYSTNLKACYCQWITKMQLHAAVFLSCRGLDLYSSFRKRLNFWHRLSCIVITMVLCLCLFNLGNIELHILKEEQNINSSEHRFYRSTQARKVLSLKRRAQMTVITSSRDPGHVDNADNTERFLVNVRLEAFFFKKNYGSGLTFNLSNSEMLRIQFFLVKGAQLNLVFSG